MEIEPTEKLQEWIGQWNDLVDFEVVPVINSDQVKEKAFADE